MQSKVPARAGKLAILIVKQSNSSLFYGAYLPGSRKQEIRDKLAKEQNNDRPREIR